MHKRICTASVYYIYILNRYLYLYFYFLNNFFYGKADLIWSLRESGFLKDRAAATAVSENLTAVSRINKTHTYILRVSVDENIRDPILAA